MQALMAAMMGGTRGKKPEAKVLAPAAQWGMQVYKAADDEEAGVTIKEVLAETAAAEAGLKAGDRLLTLDGRWTDTVADCYTAAGHVKLGTAVKVTIRRAAKELVLTVKPRAGL
jgi:S1-C subfamily serine protease